MTQQFQKGDLVHVAKDLGQSMNHFANDIDAIVIGSYNDQYGGGDTRSYTLHLKGQGQCSWYDEHQLELIERNRDDLLAAWQAEKEAEDKQKADIDWIFEHGPEVMEGAHGASIETLGRDVGITNLWGSHGEGFVYYENALSILAAAGPFLLKHDKAGWRDFCGTLRR